MIRAEANFKEHIGDLEELKKSVCKFIDENAGPVDKESVLHYIYVDLTVTASM